MTAQGSVPERAISESELQDMKDRELLVFIDQTVATLHRLGDRLEAFAVPAGGRRDQDGQSKA